MRTRLVIPLHEIADLTTHCFAVGRHHDSSHPFMFHGADESFNYRNAAVLTDSPVARPDALAIEPAFEVIGLEYFVLVANQMLRGGSKRDGLPEKGRERERSRAFWKDGKSNGASRIMVNDNGDPPAKWPALR